MTPTLSLIIPTAGRETLRRTLDSAAPQMLPGDECIVVGDTLVGPLPQTEAICAEYPWVRYLSHAGTAHTYGHEQFDAGLQAATGDWLLGNDDDDIWTPDAFTIIRGVIAGLDQPRPLLFRFRSAWGMVYWLQAGLLGPGTIGGHCLVQPGHAHGKVGRRVFGHYEGDHAWIMDTLTRWEPLTPVWHEAIIAIARP